MPEWQYAWHLLLWGGVLIHNDDQFQQPTFSGFLNIFGDHEKVIGGIMVLLSIARLGALMVNGARKDVTPHIRQFSAGIGFIIWAGMTYCYATSNVLSTWFAIYPVLAVGELVNIYRAARDQGETRNGRAA